MAACRRVLVDLEEADIAAGGERAAPRGILTLTAPVITGEDLIQPAVDAFMNEYPAVSVRLLLIDRQVNPDRRRDRRRAADCPSCGFEFRCNPPRRSSSRDRGVARLSCTASGHPRAGRSGEAPDRFDDPFRPELLELPAVEEFVGAQDCAIHAKAHRQYGSRGSGLRRRRQRRHPPLFLSHCRADSGRTAENPPRQGRTSAVAGAHARASGTLLRAEGTRLRRFRRAAVQVLFRAIIARRRGKCQEQSDPIRSHSGRASAE